jgi:hypothetical protein
MTTERDTRTRIVLSWLRDDAHEDAERVLLRALDEVDTTPQRRPVWPARRNADMNAYAKLAIAVTAVVVIAVAGLQLLPRNSSSGGGPAATSSPTASPTPTAAPPIPSLGSASLAPGRYALTWSGPTTSIQVPAGWTGTDAGVVKHPDTDGELNWGGWAPAPTQIFSDACRSDGTLKPTDGTLQGLVDSLDAQQGTDATVTDVTLGGVAGKRVDLAPAAGLDRSKCNEGTGGPLKIWLVESDGDFALAPGNRGIVEAAIVDGRLAVFVGGAGAGSTTVEVAELESVIDSTRFDP